MARKLTGFDPQTQRALELLSRDSGKSLQELADEAFADLFGQAPSPQVRGGIETDLAAPTGQWEQA